MVAHSMLVHRCMAQQAWVLLILPSHPDPPCAFNTMGVQSVTLCADPDTKKWEYVDLQGQQHGHFSSKQMLKWSNNVFPPDLQVLPYVSGKAGLGLD